MSGFRQRIPAGRTIRFTFDGVALQAIEGDTVASALMANGVSLVGRSFKYHRPRGVFSDGADDPSALITVGDGSRATPNLHAGLIEVTDGMVVRSQNRWPSLKRDFASLNDRLSRFLGAGFYYKTFMAPGSAWEKLFEPAIRKAAGLGEAPRSPDPDLYETVHHHCDCLVVGGGLSGMTAAREAAASANDVILCEQRAETTPPTPVAVENGLTLSGAIFRPLTRTTVVGLYDHGMVAAVERCIDGSIRERLHLIRAKHIILATGAQERLIAFENNDRPGVMLASAAERMLHRHGVLPGKAIAIFALHDEAYGFALILKNLGVLAAIIDPRERSPAMVQAMEAGLPVHAASVVTNVIGNDTVAAIGIRQLGGTKGLILACNALLVSGGFNPNLQLLAQAGGTTRFDVRRHAFVPDRTPSHITVIGNAAGDQLPAVEPLFEVPTRNGGAKSFVDLNNDVTAKDMRLAAQEGYQHIEHAKRYTTHGMGTDQGKSGGFVGAAILADALGKPLSAVGVSKPRPFVVPSTWGALAGPETGEHFKPARRLPLHDWHERQGAVFLRAGAWLRPLYYTKSGEAGWDPVLREARAVRNAVGITDVSSLGKIDVQGLDAARFLDRIYANTISTLKIGFCRYGLMLRDDGMVMDDGTVARIAQQHFLLTTTTVNASAVLEHMEFHSALWPEMDVHLTAVTDQFAQIALAGPKARDVLMKLTGQDVSNEALPFMAFADARIAGLDGRIYRISFSGELAYELAVDARHASALADAVCAAGQDFGLTVYGLDALNTLRIEKGHVTTAEITGTTTADDLGFAKMLKKSGDFIGAKLAQRPALLQSDRQHLVGVRLIEGSRLRGGAVLLEDIGSRTSLGHLSSVTRIAEGEGWIGLALLAGGRMRIGQKLVAASPVYKERAMVEIVSPHHIDPENARVRS
jgi:methylglutamate dehydrogenase subunit C